MNTIEVENHIAILVQIIRSIQQRRAITEIDADPPLNFWRVILGGFLDLSVLEWCKIFGSNNENTHWKVIVKNDDDRDMFRNDLFLAIGITAAQWDENWNSLKNYRDELVAHHCPEKTTHYPRLEIALQSSFFYYNYLNDIAGKKRSDTIEKYAERFYQQSLQIAAQAIGATKIFKEEVF